MAERRAVAAGEMACWEGDAWLEEQPQPYWVPRDCKVEGRLSAHNEGSVSPFLVFFASNLTRKVSSDRMANIINSSDKD